MIKKLKTFAFNSLANLLNKFAPIKLYVGDQQIGIAGLATIDKLGDWPIKVKLKYVLINKAKLSLVFYKDKLNKNQKLPIQMDAGEFHIINVWLENTAEVEVCSDKWLWAENTSWSAELVKVY